MCLNHHITNDFIAVLFCNFPNREEIAQRLGHFLVVNIDIAVVHPVMRECLACSSFTLCNFILVMRENQVLTAAVQIERIAQIVRRHCRAFNMPARATLAPWRFPVWFTRLCSFPNSKVQRIFFLVIDINSSTCLQFFHRLTGKLAIVGKRSGAEVNIAVGFICMTAFHKFLHHVNNQIHVFCYFRMDVRIHNI